MIFGLFGLLFFVSFSNDGLRLYEFIYGSVLDIVGKNVVNLFGMILFLVMCLCESLN